MRSPLVALPVALFLAAVPFTARAQIEAPTPIEDLEQQQRDALDQVVPADAPAHRPAAKAATSRATEEDEPVAPSTRPVESREPALESAAGRLDPKAPPQAAAVPAKAVVPAADPAPVPTIGEAKAIELPKATEADLVATWASWKKATGALDVAGAEKARKQLLALKAELAITDLDPFAVGFVRAAEQRRAANDPTGAIELAHTAVELAPNLPYAHVALAHAYLASDWSKVGPYLTELKSALTLSTRDPRFARPLLGDLGTSLLFALAFTAVAVVVLLFVRGARYFLHDFHHFFPRAAARWQSAALAVLLLSLPLVFHLGVAPILLTLFAAVTFYLSVPERAVATAAIAVLGLLPSAAGALVERTAFIGTVAEDVAALERGGLDASGAAARIRARVAEDKAGFLELYALGRAELRRGRLEPAIEGLKKAAVLRTSEPRLLTTLANAMFAKGDAEGAAQLYAEASQADGSLAAAWYNLSKVHYRKASTLPSDLVGTELEKGQSAIKTAQSLDDSLLARDLRPDGVTEAAWEGGKMRLARYLISPALSTDEVVSLAGGDERAEKVKSQVALKLLGNLSPRVAAIYPFLGAALLFAFGFLRVRAGACKRCDKCGRPVCRKCDPELGIGGGLCNQCVNAFARKNLVAPQVRARKLIEIERFHRRQDRVSYVLGMLCSGAGHLFSGVPVRGALYALLFTFVVSAAFFGHGVMRPTYDGLPDYVRWAPLGVVFLLLYGLSLRGLYRRQTE